MRNVPIKNQFGPHNGSSPNSQEIPSPLDGTGPALPSGPVFPSLVSGAIIMKPRVAGESLVLLASNPQDYNITSLCSYFLPKCVLSKCLQKHMSAGETNHRFWYVFTYSDPFYTYMAPGSFLRLKISLLLLLFLIVKDNTQRRAKV